MSRPDRLTVLAEPGPWTTSRVQRLYRACGNDAPQRSTARRDLTQLHRRGLLVRDDTRHDRQYHRKH